MKYNILYLDPPWKYDNGKSANPAWGGKTYPTMSDKELATIPFKDIAADNALMFCWMTMPRLLQQLQLMQLWGFTPSSCGFVWVKQNPSGVGIYSGLGSYTCGNAELCYIGKRGKALTRSSKSVKQVVFAPVGRHSAKPDEVAKRIDILYGPEYRRVELFARTAPWADHWDATGLEYDGMDIRDFLVR